ncbi:Replication initiation protein [Candidatus Brocadiaceae bacterium]|nr:Replication initiation protein [Candidatus Brocadiaceae bacterium]
MEIISLDFDSITKDSLNGASIRKHNDLIEAKYQLPNLQEQRIILMLLGQIKPSDDDFKCYRITVSDFAEILGVRADRMYEELIRTLKNLMSRMIHIKNGNSFLLMSWLSSAEYKSGSGYIELAFDPKLKPYLLQLKEHYTQFQLNTVLHFKSIYAIRLYELLKKEAFKAKNSQFSVYFEYIDLREKFGIGKKEYANFKDFRVKTIQPAITEISDKTDLIINDVKYGKTGRKITNITFVVGIRSENETKLRQANMRIEEIKPERESEKHSVIDALIELGFTLETAKAYKTKHGVKKIERNIAYTLAKKQAGKVGDIPAYLNKAIENDYGGGAWELEQKKKEETKKEHERLEKERLAKEAKQAKAEAERKAQLQQTFDRFLALPTDQQTELRDQFLKVADGLAREKASTSMRKGEPFYTSPIVSSNFKIFLNTRKLV